MIDKQGSNQRVVFSLLSDLSKNVAQLKLITSEQAIREIVLCDPDSKKLYRVYDTKYAPIFGNMYQRASIIDLLKNAKQDIVSKIEKNHKKYYILETGSSTQVIEVI